MGMLELKYASPTIRQMTEEEVDILADLLLPKIHMVTGWTIPEGTNSLILAEQFKLHLTEKYANMNSDEIMAAFRRSGTTTKDWGKSMNLNLIDQVLIPYLEQRFDLSQIEEQAKIKKDMIELPPSPMPDQEIVDYAYDTWNATGKFEFIAKKTFTVLKKYGYVPTEQERLEILQSAKNAVTILFLEDRELEKRGNKDEYIQSYAKKIFCQMVFKRFKEAGEKLTLPCQTQQ